MRYDVLCPHRSDADQCMACARQQGAAEAREAIVKMLDARMKYYHELDGPACNDILLVLNGCMRDIQARSEAKP